MRLRSREAEQARYTWLTPRAFGQEIGVEEGHVRAMIAEGWFRRGVTPPECMDVRRPNAKRPEYRIHRNAIARFFKERAR